jgi:DNA gyrase subunit A
MLIDGLPMRIGIKVVLDNWLEFRRGSIKNRLEFEIDKIEQKLHLLHGLEKVLLDLDNAIAIIRNTKNDKKVIPNLMKNFDIDEIQSEFVANIKLRNINKEYIVNKTIETKNLEKEMKNMNSILKSKKKIDGVIKKELETVSKTYGTDRRTNIVFEEDIIDLKPLEIIKDYNLEIFLTDHNYFKKISLASLRLSGDHKLKEDDSIVQSFECSNKDEILLFSNKQIVYKRFLYEIDDHKTSKLGIYLPNILEMEKDEEIIYMVPTKDYKGHMLFGFENGKVQKLPLNAYETKTNRKYLKNAYSDKSKIIGILYIKEDRDILMARYSYPNDYRILVVNSSLIPEKITRRSSGVTVLRLKKDSEMTVMKFADKVKIENAKQYYNTKIPRSGMKIDHIEMLKSINTKSLE